MLDFSLSFLGVVQQLPGRLVVPRGAVLLLAVHSPAGQGQAGLPAGSCHTSSSSGVPGAPKPTESPGSGSIGSTR